MSNADFALAYASLGWHVFPLAQQTKDPIGGSNGFKDASCDLARIRAIWEQQPQANIGVYPYGSQLVAVDIDVKHGDGFADLEALEIIHGPLPPTLTNVTPSGGKHYIFRCPVPLGNHKIAPNIDIRSANGYIVAEPSVANGKQYSWLDWDVLSGEVPEIADLPQWVVDLSLAAAERSKSTSNSENAPRFEPVSDVAMPALRDRLDRFLEQAPKARYRWNGGSEGMRDPSGSGMDISMVAMLKAAGFSYSETVTLLENWPYGSSSKQRSGARYWQRAWMNSSTKSPEEEPEMIKIDVSKIVLGQPQPVPDETKQELKFPFSPIDISEITEIDWTVEDYLESDSLALIFGEPGSGKSFVAIDLASCVATGHAWHGHDVKKGAVFYIAGEGFNGLTRRFRAWEIRNHVSLSGAPIFRSHKPARLYDRQSAIDVAESVYITAQECGVMPTLIVVDTIARNMGGDENSTQDMNAFIEHLDACLRVPYRATVLCVHHSGKASPGQARGSSALRGALDAEYMIELEQTSKTIVMSNRKMKDADIPPEKRFYIESVDLGLIDKKGNPITGAALDAVDISGLVKSLEEKREHLGKNQRKIVEALDGLIFARQRDPHNMPITTDDLRDAAMEKGVEGKRFSEALNALEQKNKIKIWPGNVVEVVKSHDD